MAKETYNKTISRPLADLHFHPANPRDHSEESTRRLADSIKEDPTYFEAHPILLSDRTGELVIIGGEGRCRAARYLGMTEAPTFLFDGLTEEDEVRIMQKDNDHSGKWNDSKLQELAAKWGEDKIHSWAPNVVWGRKTANQKETGELHINLQKSAFIVEVKCQTITERNRLIDYINSNGYEFICK